MMVEFSGGFLHLNDINVVLSSFECKKISDKVSYF